MTSETKKTKNITINNNKSPKGKKEKNTLGQYSINKEIKKLNNDMKNRIIRGIAGVFILMSLTLGYYINDYWFFFTAFVGVNLFQSSITQWCLMEDILEKLGVKN